jgi:hypothetical protein
VVPAGCSAAAALVLLLTGCSDPYQPAEPEVADRWCSDDGVVLTLAEDATFAVSGMSRVLAEAFLPADGYVDDYRIQRDYAGQVPSTASGTWEVFRGNGDALEYHDSGVYLTLEKVGSRAESDDLSIYFDGERKGWGFALLRGADFIRYFDRCMTAAG